MPEWNLVVKSPVKKCLLGILPVLIVAVLQVGCSELRQSTFDRDFLTKKPAHPSWAADPIDSADQYIADTNQVLESERPKDQARIVGVSDKSMDPNEKQIKLVANPSALSSASSQKIRAKTSESACDHLAQCDCYKRQLKPKLPHAEPIEPPPISTISPRIANLLPERAVTAPPSAVVSQPLAPIMLNSQPRAVEVNTRADEDQYRIGKEKSWSSEKPVGIEVKPVAASQTTVNQDSTIESVPNPVRLTRISDRASQQMRTIDWRVSNPAEATDFEVPARDGCEGCNSLTCDKNCLATKRGHQEEVSPVVQADPVCIVATTSVDTIPPFADCPVEDEIKGVITLGAQQTENRVANGDQVINAIVETTEKTAADAVSFDDLDDEQWDELWGSAKWEASTKDPSVASAAPDCTSCPEGNCLDLNCDQLPANSIAAKNSFSRPPQNDFPVASIEESPMTASVVESKLDDALPLPVKPIEVTAPKESNNDFAPATHLADIPNYGTPTKSETKTTIELPKLESINTTVSVPDGGKTLWDRRGKPTDHVITTAFPLTSGKPKLMMMTTPTLQIVEEEPLLQNPELEVNLRLLEMLQRQMDGLEKRQQGLTASEREFWQKQFESINQALSGSDYSDSDLARLQTAKDLLEDLKQSVRQLESQAKLKVFNGEFCTEISGFGQFRAFPSTQFRAQQRMLIYCEVENYTSAERDLSFHTTLRGSYLIRDGQGRAVQQAQFATVEDVSSSRRHDFYMYFPIQLTELPPGEYRLELNVEDTLANQTASLEPNLTFQVK